MTDERPKTWKVVAAAILDFILVFVVGGYVIALLTGSTTENGFQLNGWPVLLLIAVIILYFRGMKRVGGTLFKRLFGIAGQRD
ncbi:MAG: hypothetical protein HC844_02985 [Tabrizicola sp.]|nr:hypothetical protein [Tabrizicola sp.]